MRDPKIWEIVAANLGLCGMVAKRFLGRGLDLEDLVQEGAFGLYRAIERFDPSRAALSTYAKHWIARAIREAIYRTGGTVRVPRRTPALPVGSLEVEVAARPDRFDPDQLEQLAAIDAAINGLSPRERTIIRSRFGFDDAGPMSIRQVAVCIGVSPQRAHQIEKVALAKVRKAVA